MKKSIAMKWIKALRSGEYEQCQDQLVRADGESDSFCCLGVLCNLATEHGVGEWKEDMYVDEEDRADSGAPPKGIVKWAGMHREDPAVEFEGEELPLSVLNDSHKLSFNQIADIIEESWEML